MLSLNCKNYTCLMTYSEDGLNDENNSGNSGEKSGRIRIDSIVCFKHLALCVAQVDAKGHGCGGGTGICARYGGA